MKRVLRYFGKKSSGPETGSDEVSDARDGASIPAATTAAGDWSRFDPLEPRFVALLARLDMLNQRA